MHSGGGAFFQHRHNYCMGRKLFASSHTEAVGMFCTRHTRSESEERRANFSFHSFNLKVGSTSGFHLNFKFGSRVTRKLSGLNDLYFHPGRQFFREVHIHSAVNIGAYGFIHRTSNVISLAISMSGAQIIDFRAIFKNRSAGGFR